MKMHTLIIAVLVIIVLGALLAFASKHSFTTEPEPTTFAECAARYPVMESYPRQCKTPSGQSFTEEIVQQPTPPVITPGLPDLITISSPTTGSKITSPLVATGSARGTWYFEASFPIEVRDAAGNVIGQGHAEAQGDWMTEDFVPFKSVAITFTAQPAGSTGTVVFKNDNPSGDPARDKSVSVPVTF